MKLFCLLLFFLGSCSAQSPLVYSFLGQPQTAENEYSIRHIFNNPYFAPEQNKAQLWQDNTGNILARDLFYPESLSMYNRTSALGLRLPSPLGRFRFVLDYRHSETRITTSLETNSLVFKSRADFTNNRGALLLNYSNDFFGDKLGLGCTIAPLFNEHDAAEVSLWNRSDIAAALILRYRLPNSAVLWVSGSQDYFDKVVGIDVLGLASNTYFIQNIYVGNSFTVRMRNYLGIQAMSFGLGSFFFKGWTGSYHLERNKYATEGTFYWEDWADISATTTGHSLSLDRSLSPAIHFGLNSSVLFVNAEVTAKYKRANGSYSSFTVGTPLTGTVVDATFEGSYAFNNRHSLVPSLFSSFREFALPEYSLIDPVKYIGVEYGTPAIQGSVHSRVLGPGLGYTYTAPVNKVTVAFRYLEAAFNGTFLSRTTLAERDTFAVPLEKIGSVEINCSDEFSFFKRYKLTVSLSQLLPVSVKIAGRSLGSSENESIGERRYIIGLLQCGLTIRYNL